MYKKLGSFIVEGVLILFSCLTNSKEDEVYHHYKKHMDLQKQISFNCEIFVESGKGKRANRTQFTKYQIKVLQEFYEKNAYLNSCHLEYLSNHLGLSQRVIAVWFQNARQKTRKINRNRPPKSVIIEMLDFLEKNNQ